MTGIQDTLLRSFAWRGDRFDDTSYADMTGWWRNPAVLGSVGAALARLYREERPTVVVGPQSRGMLVGALTAVALRVGFVEVRKNPQPMSDSDALLRRTSAPDYSDRHKVLGFPRRLLRAGDRALMVDDWVATGATALTVRALVEDSGAEWIGVAAVVDALEDSGLRRRLPLRALLRERNL
jgi:adenine phosphoribosyltransferase